MYRDRKTPKRIINQYANLLISMKKRAEDGSKVKLFYKCQLQLETIHYIAHEMGWIELQRRILSELNPLLTDPKFQRQPVVVDQNENYDFGDQQPTGGA